jgi:hypothetical protein
MKPNWIAPLASFPPIRRTFAAITIALSLVFVVAAFGVNQGTSFTYQGQLRRSGSAYNGVCNFQFSLWDAASAGTLQSGTLAINSVNVANGLFTVVLDFGELITGGARWLATSVQCSGDGGFTQLDPRQPLTATPYALTLRPGAVIDDLEGTVSTPVLWVQSFSPNGTAVKGFRFGASGYGVYGSAGGINSAGVLGENSIGTGVWGKNSGNSGSGVFGESSSGRGVYGKSTSTSKESAGVFGENSAGTGVWGLSTGAGSAVYGQATSGGWAGRFTGSVLVEGNLIVQGSVSKPAGSFRIDHPLDPANKFLSHSFVESPDMKNIYDGNVTTDANGSATVMLPDYFEALNRDCRYQLTVLGQFAQAIVSRKIAGNTFEIRTDQPGVEVSWQVTGIRQDAYARAKPIVVEEAKPAEEQGLYLFPAGFGASQAKQIGYPSRPVTPQTEEKMTKKTK